MFRPIDIQDNLSKTPYVEKVHQVKRPQTDVDQRAFHVELERKGVADGQKPPPFSESEEVEMVVKKEGDKPMPRRRKKKESPQGKPEEGTEVSEELLGRWVDVVI